MLLVGMDGGQARLEGPLRQGLGPGGVQVVRHMEIGVVVLLRGVELLIPTDQIVFIPQVEKCRRG